jgi:EAL domain-containing protein (putative c-di-GMP-specific phosphodiesterase class I)
VPVSINVSARQFNETDVRSILAAAFERFPVQPELIEVELTESSMTGDVADVSRTISSIQDMGVKVLVDDFGTGYSSLAQLQKLDMDVLKVDRAFTLEIDRRHEGRIFFSAIITMAHALGMRVVAEGVENAEQVEILKELECDEIQGYFVSHPLTAYALQEFLDRMKEPLPETAHAGMRANAGSKGLG